MPGVSTSGSIARKLEQIELVTELISSGSIPASGDGTVESSGGLPPSPEAGNLLNTKS